MWPTAASLKLEPGLFEIIFVFVEAEPVQLHSRDSVFLIDG